MFWATGPAEKELAKELADHEGKVEELVYAPLQRAIDNELPNITKQKHNLKKYILDKDSASNRYNSTKKETIKGDMEEADSKVEQCRDALAFEMFSLLAKENELASCILQLLKLQRGYHESALKTLENVIPQLEQTIGKFFLRISALDIDRDHLLMLSIRTENVWLCCRMVPEYS